MQIARLINGTSDPASAIEMPLWYGDVENPTLEYMITQGYVEFSKASETLPVPFEVSMRQCQTYLFQMPLINDRNVLDIIEQDVVPTLSRLAQIEWKTNPPVWRSSPMVEQMRQMFGWSIEEMDQMFRDAELL